MIEDAVRALAPDLVQAAAKDVATDVARKATAQFLNEEADDLAATADHRVVPAAPSDMAPPAVRSRAVVEPLDASPVPASPTAPKVRVVPRNPVSGAQAMGDAPVSLARRAPSRSGQPELAPRCLPHSGQHYLGATEEDATAVWHAMRERYRLSPETKIVARRGVMEWLQKQRNVCQNSVHWYGDFVAVRSCPVRAPEGHPAHGTDGWYILFDPNGETFLRVPLFAEAFDAPDSRHAGVVPQLARPAWLSEERRAAAAARHGLGDTRPFAPETADDLTSNDFYRGTAE